MVAAGLLGPLLAVANRRVPVVVGEIAGGLIIGASGFDLIDPNNDTFRFLTEIGFAMLMFIVGTHLPFRDPKIRSAFRKGGAAALTTGAIAVVAGLLVASALGFPRPMIIAVLAATSSAAVALPILSEIQSSDAKILVLTSWIAIADVGTVLAIPLVMSTGHLGRVFLGSAGVLVLAGAIYLLLRWMWQRDVFRRARHLSKHKGWGLDLRMSVLALFLLAWIADDFGTSILIAGFATGAVVSFLGPPKRVAQQLVGLGEGFLVPLFFVGLGARLDLSSLGREPEAFKLAAGVLLLAIAAHLAAALVWRLPVAAGLLATAQLGVPSAIAALGLESGTITPAQAAAIMSAVLGSLAVCSVGAAMLGHDPDESLPRKLAVPEKGV